MTAVNFREHRYVTRTPEFSLEETMKRFLTYSGVHEFKFDSLYSADAVTWQGTPSVITQTGSTVELQGALTVEFAYADFPVPSNHMVSYTTTETDHGALLAYQDATGDGVGYQVLLSATDIYFYKVTGTNRGLIYSSPRPYAGGNNYAFVFRQYNFSDDKSQVWNFITAYQGTTELATWGDIYGGARSGCTVGLLTKDTAVITYTNFSVREFCETAEWGTADPGETPMNGLQRVLEGRYIRFWLRATGEFRAWKPRSVPVVHAITGEEDFRTLSEVSDFNSIATHIRMVGAYLWAEYIASDDLDVYGYRFAEDDNPMLFTEDECYYEAVKQYKRRIENAVTSSVAVQSKPFLEVDDRITVDGVDYLVSGSSISVGPGTITQTIRLRKYVWA